MHRKAALAEKYAVPSAYGLLQLCSPSSHATEKPLLPHANSDTFRPGKTLERPSSQGSLEDETNHCIATLLVLTLTALKRRHV